MGVIKDMKAPQVWDINADADRCSSRRTAWVSSQDCGSLKLGCYEFDKWLRLRHGPWQVTFASEQGTPVLKVSEPRLNIADSVAMRGFGKWSSRYQIMEQLAYA